MRHQKNDISDKLTLINYWKLKCLVQARAAHKTKFGPSPPKTRSGYRQEFFQGLFFLFPNLFGCSGVRNPLPVQK
jgi:hypothetical protein